jgi:hypothetical protein
MNEGENLPGFSTAGGNPCITMNEGENLPGFATEGGGPCGNMNDGENLPGFATEGGGPCGNMNDGNLPGFSMDEDSAQIITQMEEHIEKLTKHNQSGQDALRRLANGADDCTAETSDDIVPVENICPPVLESRAGRKMANVNGVLRRRILRKDGIPSWQASIRYKGKMINFKTTHGVEGEKNAKGLLDTFNAYNDVQKEKFVEKYEAEKQNRKGRRVAIPCTHGKNKYSCRDCFLEKNAADQMKSSCFCVHGGEVRRVAKCREESCSKR